MAWARLAPFVMSLAVAVAVAVAAAAAVAVVVAWLEPVAAWAACGLMAAGTLLAVTDPVPRKGQEQRASQR